MRPGQRLSLIQKREGRNIFHDLQDRKTYKEFAEQLEAMANLKPPVSIETFGIFINDYPGFEKDINDLTEKWEATVIQLTEETGEIIKEKAVPQFLINASKQELDRWQKIILKYGFNINKTKIKRIIRSFKEKVLIDEITGELSTLKMKKAWKREFQNDPDIDEKLLMLGKKKVAELLDNKYPLKALKILSKRIKYETKLSSIESTLSIKTGGRTGTILSGRQIFLLSISFLVCMVGIANAMLMSITERFREIATMKCLGATDGYVLNQFMMEAGIQGIVGGTMGLIIGLILSVIKNLFIFGKFLISYFPIKLILANCLFALSAGILLSIFAAIYPSWSASRMVPMEAMRVE